MLSGTGFGNDALLAHALRKQRLPKHTVDFVRSGVVEVFALQQQANTKLPTEIVTFCDD